MTPIFCSRLLKGQVIERKNLNCAKSRAGPIVTGNGLNLSLDATRPLGQLVGELNRWQPEVLVAYASMAHFLAREQLAGNLAIHPGNIFTSSEVTTPAMREITEKAWGKVVFDEYAATETATIGAECTQHHGLHLFEDLLIMENVMADDNLQVLLAVGEGEENRAVEEEIRARLVKALVAQGVAAPEVKLEKVRAFPKAPGGKTP